jgi:hypothetical protein
MSKFSSSGGLILVSSPLLLAHLIVMIPPSFSFTTILDVVVNLNTQLGFICFHMVVVIVKKLDCTKG